IRASPEIVDAALLEEIKVRRLHNSSGVVSIDGWVPKLSDRQVELARTLVSKLEASGSEPPNMEELAVGAGDEVAEVLRYLERRGDVIQVEQTRYYAASQVRILVDR